MTALEQQLENIVFEEFSKLLNTIESDFSINFAKKRYNFLLNQLDESLIANMVFVSSFESKSGFAIESCAKRIARLKFGEENVPSIINPRKIPHTIDPDMVNGQLIITDINIDNGDLRGAISAFRANNIAQGRGVNRVESQVNQETITSLLEIGKSHKDINFHTKPVDLAFFDGQNWNLMELKAGGDLDSSNAPSNVEKLLTIYTGLNVHNAKIFFATLYNKDGEGNTWKGAVKKHMAYPEMFLIGKDFWNKILPESVPFDRFTVIYKAALNKIRLNEKINAMILRNK